ncbi:YggS family pyridoxal phosphate-dependent enzyme [Thermobrachium celere]|uniref:YggS family pyridoxal phosphate-dependent enzyme n=1 Tax=Thermobrachium celere TaxID=53422 RepID=UPI00194506B4|nr:YggS family pyridoxal phosphate-dependent enzyme [Thermobrachium celere]GFR35028.1 YggS family pyridoxal phosphate enzyme [Thermobrachium celere]
MGVAENVYYIKNRIKEVCERCGRNHDEIILVGVSKTHPVEKLIEAKSAGIDIFGESKAQEFLTKYEKIEGAKWHFIGHLQKNKVKYIIDKVDLIHSLDDLELAGEINKRAQKINRVMDVLIQINIGKEQTKYGIYEEDLFEFAERLTQFNNIKIKGLMCIPPDEGDDKTRQYFKRMKMLFDKIKKLNYHNFDIKYLSMGMTHDFEIAIEEGANIIRVGTGIFGERDYTKEEKK